MYSTYYNTYTTITDSYLYDDQDYDALGVSIFHSIVFNNWMNVV